MGEPANRGRRSSSGGMMMHGVNLKRRFFVSLVLAVPILLLSSPMGLALHGIEPGAPLPDDVAALSGCKLNELIARETGVDDIPHGLAELDALPIRFDEVIDGGTNDIEAAALRFLEHLDD